MLTNNCLQINKCFLFADLHGNERAFTYMIQTNPSPADFMCKRTDQNYIRVAFIMMTLVNLMSCNEAHLAASHGQPVAHFTLRGSDC